MVDGNAESRDRASRTISRGLIGILAVAAIIGWYLYLSAKSQRAELQATLQQLELEHDTLRQELTRERQNRQLTQQSLQAESEALAQLRQSLADEQEAAQRLQDKLEQSQQQRLRLQSELQLELSKLASESAQMEQELQQRLTQQQSLSEQISAANTDRNQLAAQLEQAQQRRQQLLEQIEAVSAEVAAKENALAAANRDISQLNQQLTEARQEQRQLEARVELLSEQQQQEAAHFETLRQRLVSELNESRVEITQLKNRMTIINLTSEVLFDSGSIKIKPAGRKVLKLIAESLNAYPDRAISIEGHTDNVPIGKNLPYVSNWELSVTRALAAVDYLQRQSGV